MTHINRVVVGLNEEKKSAVILRDTPNYQEVPGMVWRSTRLAHHRASCGQPDPRRSLIGRGYP
jgi:hypothetical protein